MYSTHEVFFAQPNSSLAISSQSSSTAVHETPSVLIPAGLRSSLCNLGVDNRKHNFLTIPLLL
jgi:hypothetical protein